jgi:hypothetical protein
MPQKAESYDGEFIQLTDLDEAESRQISEELFNGDLLEWAARRAKYFGDYIVPKVIYIETSEGQQHKVAWVEHNGVNLLANETFHNHHVVCECVLCKNFNDGNGGINTTLCDTMTHALDARAEAIGRGYRSVIEASQNQGALNVLTGSKETARLFDIETMSMTAIEKVLHDDNAHPEVWHGNPISGSLPVEQAQIITGQPHEVVLHCVELLHERGRVDFDGENLRIAA